MAQRGAVGLPVFVFEYSVAFEPAQSLPRVDERVGGAAEAVLLYLRHRFERAHGAAFGRERLFVVVVGGAVVARRALVFGEAQQRDVAVAREFERRFPRLARLAGAALCGP